MGLLEEAIREHLELQRRRGGDPREIDLAEREALEPLVPGHTPDWAQGPVVFDHEHAVQSDSGASGGPLVDPAGEAQVDPAGGQLVDPAGMPLADPIRGSLVDPPGLEHVGPPGGPPVEPGQPMAEPSLLEQETAELDMSTVLGVVADAAQPQDGHLADQPHVPEFGPVRARRILAESPASAGPEPDFEWEIPGVTPSRGANR
ncbi:MAG TPA: hypothetical protein VLZ06_11780 [Solirubrobacteraceae bacterium]|nr:hypothetical protein [Solirubrobacteraceae bacterium]